MTTCRVTSTRYSVLEHIFYLIIHPSVQFISAQRKTMRIKLEKKRQLILLIKKQDTWIELENLLYIFLMTHLHVDIVFLYTLH